MVPSTQSETQIALVGAKRRREITPPLPSQGPVAEATPALEFFFYKSPGTSIQEPRKKKRPHDNKAKTACLVCRFNKRKVRILDLISAGVGY
jgi:hypothetical protein